MYRSLFLALCTFEAVVAVRLLWVFPLPESQRHAFEFQFSILILFDVAYSFERPRTSMARVIIIEDEEDS